MRLSKNRDNVVVENIPRAFDGYGGEGSVLKGVGKDGERDKIEADRKGTKGRVRAQIA